MRLYEIHAINSAALTLVGVALGMILHEVWRHWKFRNEMRRKRRIYHQRGAEWNAAITELEKAVGTDDFDAAAEKVAQAARRYEHDVLGIE